MLITSTRKLKSVDPASLAWAGLRRFHNVDWVTSVLMRIHNVPAKYHADVKKQALQIRQCITQAREYFAAAKAVSLATKPNLLYYGTMSLALAEILYKQTGDSSLDKARAEHRHHGLLMTFGGIPTDSDLPTSAGSLRARPMEADGVRKGTFELWHKSSREHPIVGKQNYHHADGGATSEYALLMGASNLRYNSYPSGGISLADCLSASPYLFYEMQQKGLTSQFVRGTMERNAWLGPEWHSQSTILLHPSNLAQQLVASLRVNANYADRIDVAQIQTGWSIIFRENFIYGSVPISLPPAAMINESEWRMWTNQPTLNEFGYLYVGMFIAGNYARYFPDKWLVDIEASTLLSLAIEDLCGLTEWRAPWLTLCELGQELLVLET